MTDTPTTPPTPAAEAALKELQADLDRRHKAAFRLAGKSLDKTQARLLGKAAAYEHAADLCQESLSALQQGSGEVVRCDECGAALAFLPSSPSRAPWETATLLAYEHAHQTALELGFPSITEALEALASPSRAPSSGWKHGFYVASRASLPERGEMWRAHREAGVPINSTWIDEDGPKASRNLSDLWVRIIAEVRRSRALILYVEPDDFPLKGALIEIGAALAFGIPVVIVAPDVVLEPRNCRPLGSWVKHPLASFAPSVEAAFAMYDAARPAPNEGETTGEGRREEIARARRILETAKTLPIGAQSSYLALIDEALEHLSSGKE